MADPVYEYKVEEGVEYRRLRSHTQAEGGPWERVQAQAKSDSAVKRDLGYSKAAPSVEAEPQSKDYKSLAEYAAARKAWLEKKKAATTVQAQAKALNTPPQP